MRMRARCGVVTSPCKPRWIRLWRRRDLRAGACIVKPTVSARNPILTPAAPPPPPRSPEKRDALQAEIEAATKELKRVRAELESAEEAANLQSFGFYKPRYGLESTAQYTARLSGIRNEQRTLVKSDKAAPCETKWTVGGSAAEGKKMVKQQAKLMLRAFNGECDAAITKVRYDVTNVEQRLEKAYDEIDKLGQMHRSSSRAAIWT